MRGTSSRPSRHRAGVADASRSRKARYQNSLVKQELTPTWRGDIIEGVHLENCISAQVAQGLDLPGHRTTLTGPWEDGMGHAQILAIHPETPIFEGAADPRCDGLALGW